MIKKRIGIVFVVVVLITLSALGGGELTDTAEQAEPEGFFTVDESAEWVTSNWFTSIESRVTFLEDDTDDQDEGEDILYDQRGSAQNTKVSNWCEDADNFDIAWPSPPPTESESGCMILMVEDDSPDADDCSYAFAKKMAIIPTHTSIFLDSSIIQAGHQNWGTDEGDHVEHLWNDYWSSGTPILCSTNNRWYGCNKNGANHFLSVELPGADSASETVETFLCYYDPDASNTRGHYRWLNTKDIPSEVDKDDDGVPDTFDCNPQEEHIHGAFPLGCNPLALEGEEGYCAVQAAPEICGDNLNNDCQGWTPGDNPLATLSDAGNGDSADSCNENQYACNRQKIIVYDEEEGIPAGVENCEAGKCYVPSEGGCLSRGGVCSWAEDGATTQCCGAGGISDLGELTTGSDKICLSNDNELVGTPTTNPSETLTFDACLGDWCWVPASGKSQFQIATIKSPEETYDVVSDAAQWYECKEAGYLADRDNLADFPGEEDGAPSSSDFQKAQNRLACYQEGDHWSWAECAADQENLHNKNVKGRVAGDGLYSFYLGEAHEQKDNPVLITPDRGAYAKLYETSSGEQQYFDFSGNTHLEFFFQFVDMTGNPLASPVLPVDVQLTISGPSDAVYIQKSVLGDVVNRPFLGDQFMHVKTDIPENLQLVSKIEIKSLNNEGETSNTNRLWVKNVYLSSDDAPALCSGIDTISGDNWLESYDDNADPSFNSRELCQAQFGDNAWLGGWESGAALPLGSANCCGNILNEYYAGPVAEDTSESGAGQRYGCWNSQVMAAGETTMNVGVEVVSGEKDVTIRSGLPDEDVSIFVLETTIFREQDEEGATQTIKYVNSDPFTITPSTSFLGGSQVISSFNVNDDTLQAYTDTYLGSTLQAYTSSSGNSLNIPAVPYLKPFYHNPATGYTSEEFTSSFPIDGGSVQIIVKPVDDYAVVASSDVEETLAAGRYPLVLEETVTATKDTPSFPCSSSDSSECLFPLKGGDVPLTGETLSPLISELGVDITEGGVPDNTLYFLRNPSPGLYDLYFVDEDGNHLLTDQWLAFTKKGNILAKRVPQQVLFAVEQEDDNINTEFVGCSAPDTIAPDTNYNNVGFCTPKAGFSCSFSNGEAIGTWTKDSIEVVGYKIKDGVDSLTVTSDDLELLTTATDTVLLPFLPDQQTSAASAVYGRNMLPNADFQERDSSDLRFWEIVGLDKESSAVAEKTVTLTSSQRLRSSKIAVPKWATYDNLALTYEGTCIPALLLYNRQGTVIPESPVEGEPAFSTSNPTESIKRDAPQPESRSGFASIIGKVTYGLTSEVDTPTSTEPSGDSPRSEDSALEPYPLLGDEPVFAVVVFTHPSLSCTVKKPMLQFIDGKHPGLLASYFYNNNYKSREFNRAGAACCPAGYCWNGFACIAPMDKDTRISEQVEYSIDVSSERETPFRLDAPLAVNYRCLAGEWTETEPKTDWNGEQQGFCRDNTQCFVLSSKYAQELNLELEAKDFSTQEGNVKFPTCINDKEYIMDNYCDQGNWTTRTKFIAEQLLNVVDGDEQYTLACQPPFTLPETESFANVLGGESSVTIPPSGPLEAPTTLRTCFPIAANSEGARLIPAEQNTCVNNVCILKKDRKNPAYIGASINKPSNSPNSFLRVFGLEPTECPEGDGFTPCVESATANLWYDDKGLVIYSKEESSVDRSIGKKIVDWFNDLLGRDESSPAASLIAERPNFREVYLDKFNDLEIRGVKELQGNKQAMVVEYENYNLPLCSFVGRNQLPSAFKKDLFNIIPEVQRKLLDCSTNDNVQRVESLQEGPSPGLEWLWPELTMKIRHVGE